MNQVTQAHRDATPGTIDPASGYLTLRCFGPVVIDDVIDHEPRGDETTNHAIDGVLVLWWDENGTYELSFTPHHDRQTHTVLAGGSAPGVPSALVGRLLHGARTD
jgi:hypothetical protein